MSSRATRPELLEQRIAENRASQGIDLPTWIFERLAVRPEDHVLELCCGTGGQTLHFLEILGESGRILGLDVSSEALKTLASRVGIEQQRKLRLVEGELDNLDGVLEKSSAFDLIFCGYGLYYSSNVVGTLNQARSWLKPGGRIAIVGPFGPNNKPLFDLVRQSGISLPDPVVYSSERFMLETVLPWGVANFESVSINTMVNPVRWTAPEKVLNYWQSTTFYEPRRRMEFERLLQQHFQTHTEFVNEKWVMMLEMTHARA